MQHCSIPSFCTMLGLLALVACGGESPTKAPLTFPANLPVVPEYGLAFDVLRPEFLDVIDVDGAVEVLAGGFTWAEGPVWVPDANRLLFSDVPGNVVYRYNPATVHPKRPGVWGVDTFLYPSGYLAQADMPGEAGANGLILGRDGHLLLAQHGERQVARLTDDLARGLAVGRMWLDTHNLEPIARAYGGRRLNSPNDLVEAADGTIYFTDPTYGVDKTFGDTARQLDFAGVYRVAPGDTAPVLLYRDLTRPNGVVLTPDGAALIVANSDPDKLIYLRCALPPAGDTALASCTTFAEVTALRSDANPGSADGMVMLDSGVLLATGPGGVLVFSATGEHLGTIRTGRPTANVTVGGPDGRDIYITANDLLLQARLK